MVSAAVVSLSDFLVLFLFCHASVGYLFVPLGALAGIIAIYVLPKAALGFCRTNKDLMQFYAGVALTAAVFQTFLVYKYAVFFWYCPFTGTDCSPLSPFTQTLAKYQYFWAAVCLLIITLGFWEEVTGSFAEIGRSRVKK
jgi:hypothetical protein